jgi:hypothetical protein
MCLMSVMTPMEISRAEYSAIRLGQVRWSFVNLRRRSGVSVRARDCSDYRLDRIDGAAIADPETGSSPGNLLTAMHSWSSANCSSQKYDKLKYGIDIPSHS